MSNDNDNLAILPDDILGIIERRARQVHEYVMNPTKGFSPDDLCRHIAGMYAFAERLKEMSDVAKEKAAKDADKNGEARAN